MFGPDLVAGASVAGQGSTTFPADGCKVIINEIRGKIALIHRGGCMFVEKVFIVHSYMRFRGIVILMLCS